jgi:hypothetical protein
MEKVLVQQEKKDTGNKKKNENWWVILESRNLLNCITDTTSNILINIVNGTLRTQKQKNLLSLLAFLNFALNWI